MRTLVCGLLIITGLVMIWIGMKDQFTVINREVTIANDLTGATYVELLNKSAKEEFNISTKKSKSPIRYWRKPKAGGPVVKKYIIVSDEQVAESVFGKDTEISGAYIIINSQVDPLTKQLLRMYPKKIDKIVAIDSDFSARLVYSSDPFVTIGKSYSAEIPLLKKMLGRTEHMSGIREMRLGGNKTGFSTLNGTIITGTCIDSGEVNDEPIKDPRLNRISRISKHELKSLATWRSAREDANAGLGVSDMLSDQDMFTLVNSDLLGF